MWFQSGATWTIWCDVPLDLMDWRVIYVTKITSSGQKHVDWGTGWMGWMDWRVTYVTGITSSGQNMLIEVWAEWAEWIDGSYMSQKSQVQDKTFWLRYGLNGLTGHICHKNHKFRTKHVDWGMGWMGWMDWRVIYGIKITSSRPNMLIEVRAEWAEWI